MGQMNPSPHVSVRIDLAQVRRNVASIRERTGVPIIAVVKADAYGLGIDRVVPAIADLVQGWCVFSLMEAAPVELGKTGKESLMLGPGNTEDVNEFVVQRVRPSVWDVERAAKYRAARPILSVDTGMQRFACPPGQIEAVIKAGGCDEAFTHATSVQRVHRLLELVGGRGLKLHAAGTSLLDEPQARLDAVRPGLAMYVGAARVSARLVEVHDSTGPAGYSGFVAQRHGVIVCGYSNGLRAGRCIVNGRKARILEVGMQSAFIELAPGDRVGDEVVLLGEGLSETEVAAEWKTSPHEVLVRLCSAGNRVYRDA
jgi:alanine racemase